VSSLTVMELSRRHFVELFAAAGASTLAPSWLLDRILALESAGELPVAPGPGIETWLPTTCTLCPGGCGLEARRIDGLPIAVRGFADHPVNRGRICSLPHAAIEMLFSPDRVRRPLKRTGRRGQGRWSEITWEEAEATILERLEPLVGSEGGRGLAFLDGRRAGMGRAVAAAFLAGVGSPNHVSSADTGFDDLTQRMFGWKNTPGVDLERSRIVLLFHFDHLETDGSPVWQSRIFAQGCDRSIDRPVYIGVGPRLLGSLSKCDHWLPARPGTEALVALAMANEILKQGWENRDFLARHTDWPVGANTPSAAHNGLWQLVQAIAPTVAAEVTGVPAARIEESARQFVEHQPGVALVGPGTPASPTGALTFAAVHLLNVLVGAVGKMGTLVERRSPSLGEVAQPSGPTPTSVSPENAITTPRQLARALVENEPNRLNLLLIRDADPVFDSPLGSTFRRGLAPNDRMIVVFATHLNDTANLADLVLPEATFLERWDVLTDTPMFPLGHASLQQPAISPLFSSRQSEATLARLIEALGDRALVRFADTEPEAMVRHALRPLENDPRGALYGAAQEPADLHTALTEKIVWAFREMRTDAPQADATIQTSPAQILGLPEEPSNIWLRDAASPVNVGLVDRHPYQLFVFRTQQLRDGIGASAAMMMELAGHWSGTIWAPWAEMHPRTAAEAGIANGDLVRIVSELGHIEVKAIVSEATPPGVVAVPTGFAHASGGPATGVGTNVNAIVAAVVDPLREQTMRVNVRSG